MFAQPRGDGLAALLGNLDQSVFGEPAYPTVESKAAHLLYFVVKNHPFSDGNKRSGAFLFVDFLHRNGRLLNAQGEAVINDRRVQPQAERNVDSANYEYVERVRNHIIRGMY